MKIRSVLDGQSEIRILSVLSYCLRFIPLKWKDDYMEMKDNIVFKSEKAVKKALVAVDLVHINKLFVDENDDDEDSENKWKKLSEDDSCGFANSIDEAMDIVACEPELATQTLLSSQAKQSKLSDSFKQSIIQKKLSSNELIDADTKRSLANISKGKVNSHQPSKRALAMVSASQTTLFPQKKKSLIEGWGKPASKENKLNLENSSTSSSQKQSVFKSLKNTQISTTKRNIFEFMDSNDLSIKQSQDVTVTSKKLKCLICQEIPTVPCSGKCGHVCCKVCWETWLNNQQNCPVCRISILSITPLLISKSNSLLSKQSTSMN